MLSIGLHGRIIGRPGRATGLERSLEALTRDPRHLVARRVDIARWWRERYPADSTLSAKAVTAR